MEVTVITQRGVTAGSGRVGVVSAHLAKKGSRVGAGPAQSSLSNYPLQPTACGRLGVGSRSGPHAAAERER